MTKLIERITLLTLLFSFQLNAQITLEKHYLRGTSVDLNWWYTKLSPTKTKYILFNDVTRQFSIFNQDHSIYKVVTIPTQTGVYGVDWLIDNNISFCSEILFNTDTLFEYVIYSKMPSGPYSYFKVYTETGAVIFQEDSVFTGGGGQSFPFNSPSGIKLHLYRATSTGNTFISVYGVGGTFIGNKTNALNSEEFDLYPNPSQNYFKLDYSLPSDINEATMEIYDVKGTLIKTYRISNMFNEILVETSSFSPGTYLVKVSNGESTISKKYIKM